MKKYKAAFLQLNTGEPYQPIRLTYKIKNNRWETVFSKLSCMYFNAANHAWE